MVFTFLENALNLVVFTHAPPPLSKLFPKFLSLHLRQGENTHSARQHFLENLFSQQQKGEGGNYHLLYQNSGRKYEDDLEH